MAAEEAEEFVTVILPVYKNEAQLSEMVTRIDQQFAVLSVEGEILLVDDGSGQQTWEVIRRVASTTPRVVGVRLSRNFGQHAAIRAGLEIGRGTLFVLMDADLENRPEDISRLYWSLKKSDNQIILARWANSPQRRRFSSVFHRLVADGHYEPADLSGVATFRIFTRKIRNELLKYREQGAVFGPIMHQLGFAFSYLPVQRDIENAPPSRYNLRRRLNLAKPLIVTFLLGAVLPVFVVTGMIATLLAFVAAVIVAVRFVAAGGDLISTNAVYGLIVGSLVGYLSLGVAVLIFVSNSILSEVRGRPSYHIAETTAETKSNQLRDLEIDGYS